MRMKSLKQSVGGYIFRILSVGNKMIQKVLVSKADKKDKGNEPDKLISL